MQEGGYNNRSIGTNAKGFFSGFLSGRNNHLRQQKERRGHL
jgi:hypothetical protein